MNREELIELVVRIQLGEGTEKEIDNLVGVIKKNVIDPEIINYVFGKKYENLSAEEIVDKALSYKPIQL